MDLEHLTHRESEERRRAADAASGPARAAHAKLADLYRARIDGDRAPAQDGDAAASA